MMASRNIAHIMKLMAGPAAALLCAFFFRSSAYPDMGAMAGILLWMAIWWLTEVVDVAVTALVPFIFLPIAGIADSRTIAAQYMDPIIFLFVGGFIIAYAIEKWHLHERLALYVLKHVGTHPMNILLGVMFTSFIASMWISNTATVMMLLPAVNALIRQLEKHISDKDSLRRMSSALLIGLAYSASIGGMATLVGTPTNMIFYREYNEVFKDHTEINFLRWFMIGFPVAVIMMMLAALILRFLLLSRIKRFSVPSGWARDEHRKIGPWSYESVVISVLFFVTVLLWFTREDIDIGFAVFKGWNRWLHHAKYLHDGTVACLMALLLFIIPSRKNKGKALMSWQDVSKLPYGIILLFGSGFALAKGFEVSGLNHWFAMRLAFLEKENLYVVITVVCASVLLLSEFASNVTSIQLAMPVLISMCSLLDVHPLVILVPATLAASMGFMLPVATAANTIVFGTGYIRSRDMMKAGVLLNICGVILLTVLSWVMITVFQSR
jgi:sodium-dependent dicarboxylate transporter 2/3/5